MKEYNLLTQKLIAEGYTADHHPDYVMVEGWGKKSLDNYHGGFQYYGWYIYEKTFKTPCGMQCKGKFAMTGLSWLGTDWSYENDCPTILCPKGITGCDLREEPFRCEKHGVNCQRCVVHETDEEYQYEGSCEAEKHLLDDQIRMDKISFIMERKGRVCENHMHYDRETGKWSFHYNPMGCANGFCRAQSTDFKDGGYCPVLGKNISKEKGNVFYDVKWSGRDYSKDGTLFEGERFERIIKGRQLFDKPIHLDIAKVIAKLCRDEIAHRHRYNSRDFDSLTMFRAERGEIDLHWEILNIRAEKKAVRDFEQDLKDIDNGIQIIHEQKVKKDRAAEKSKRRMEAKEKRIKAMEKKLLSVGYENMERSDQNRAVKLLGGKRIDELEEERIMQEQKRANEPTQMSLFDMGLMA